MELFVLASEVLVAKPPLAPLCKKFISKRLFAILGVDSQLLCLNTRADGMISANYAG